MTKESSDKGESGRMRTSKLLQELINHCKQMLHFQSLRDLQYAFQMTTAFVVCTLIAYKSPYSREIVIPYFLAWLAPVLITDTVGGTFSVGRSCLLNYVPATIFIRILQEIGMGYMNYVSTTILFLLHSFWIGYTNPTIATRRIALILPAVLYCSLFTTPRDELKKHFLWEVLCLTCVAVGIDLAISIFIFPRFASIETQDRFVYSLQRSKEVLELITEAVWSSHRSDSEVFLCEAESILNNINANQEIMLLRTTQSEYEPVQLLRRLLRGKQVALNKLKLNELTQLSSNIAWHLTSIIHSARNINYNEYHSILSNKSRESVRATILCFMKTIDLLSSRIHNEEEINTTLNELNTTCDHMFSVLSQSMKQADIVIKEHEDRNSKSITTANDSKGGSKPVANNNKTAAEYKNMPADTTYNIGNFDIDAKKGANRLSFGFCLFHFSELLQSIDTHFGSNFTQPNARHRTVSLSDITISQRMAINNNSSGSDNIYENSVLSWCFGVLNALHMYGYEQYIYMKTDCMAKCKIGLRTAALMGVAMIFIEVPKLAMKFENGQWIIIAVIMSQGDNLGSTLYQSRNRFLGTLFGAIFGYFVFLSVGTDLYSIIAMYVPFLLLCGVIKQSRQWGYFGSIGATTAIIVTLGRVAFRETPQGDYSLLRIQQNAVGILLALGYTLLTMQLHAVDLLKMNIMQVFDKLSSSSSKVLEVYKTTVNSVTLDDESAVQTAVDNLSSHGIQVSRSRSRTSSIVQLPPQQASQIQQTSQPLQQEHQQISIQLTEINNSHHNTIENNSQEDNQMPLGIIEPDKSAARSGSFVSIFNSNLSSNASIFSKSNNIGIQINNNNALNSDSKSNKSEFNFDINELLVVDHHKKIQLIQYIATEGVLIRTKLSQQPLLIEQAAMEFTFWSKPFPEETYTKLITCQKRILHMMITIDRALLRISKITQLKVVKSSLQFGQKVSNEVSILLNEVILNLRRWKDQIENTMHHDSSSITIGIVSTNNSNNNNNNKTNSNSNSNAIRSSYKYSRPTSDSIDNNDTNTNNLDSSNNDTSSILTREEHSRGLAKMQQSALILSENSLNFNNDMMIKWLGAILAQENNNAVQSSNNISETMHVINSDTNGQFMNNNTTTIHDSVTLKPALSADELNRLSMSTDANIHHLFDMSTTFNALFYASAHLSNAVMDLGNVLYAILLVEKKVNHKAY